jgi:hypothetical protein
MKINRTFIKDQFNTIKLEHRFEWALETDYILTLENQWIKLEFQTEKWNNGMLLLLRIKESNKFYDLFDLTEIIGKSNINSFLTISEKEFYNTIEHDNDKMVFAFKSIIEQYFTEVLTGNYTLLGNK